jgi:hypothetical protein
MEKLKVIDDDGETIEVYCKPEYRHGSWGFIPVDKHNGVWIDTQDCTPVPAETAPEKARRLWEEWGQESPTPPDDERARECFHRANKYINALLAEIDRIKSEMWTDEDMRDAAKYVYISDPSFKCFSEAFSQWLAARRAAKAKE